MLEVVADHTDQADAECHRRVPTPVNDPIEVGVGQARDVVERLLVHVVVVVDEQRSRLDTHMCDLVRGMPVSGRADVEGQPEPLGPTGRGPSLIEFGDVRDMVVLYAREMPYEPRDR